MTFQYQKIFRNDSWAAFPIEISLFITKITQFWQKTTIRRFMQILIIILYHFWAQKTIFRHFFIIRITRLQRDVC